MPFSFSVPAFLSPRARSAFSAGPRPVSRRSSAAAVLASMATIAAASLTAGAGEGAVTMNIWDDGTNLIMSATGDYDLTNATRAGGPVNSPHSLLDPTGVIGYPVPDSDWYTATFSGTLTGGIGIRLTTTTTTNPFFFWPGFSAVVFSGGLTGSVNESATLLGTLAGYGYVAGESIAVSWGNGGVNEQGTINVLSAAPVPEPSTWALGAFALACGGWQLTRRRRARRLKA